MSEQPKRSTHERLQEQADFLAAFHFAYTQEYVDMLLTQIKMRDTYINDLEHTLLSCRALVLEQKTPYSEGLCQRVEELMELDK